MEPITFMTSLLVFYLRGKIQLDRNTLHIIMPRTVLGLIPFGGANFDFPLTQLSSVKAVSRPRIGKWVLAALCLIFGLSFISEPNTFDKVLSIIALVLAVHFALDAMEVDLELKNVSGETVYVDFFVFEKAKAKKAEEQINAAMRRAVQSSVYGAGTGGWQL